MIMQYYDTTHEKPQTVFYKTVVVNKATASNIVSVIHKAFEEYSIPQENVLQFMSDSSNVMRGKHSGVFTQIKDKYIQHIVDLGGCSLHHVHNTVSYGIDGLSAELEGFAVHVYILQASNWTVRRISRCPAIAWCGAASNSTIRQYPMAEHAASCWTSTWTVGAFEDIG